MAKKVRCPDCREVIDVRACWVHGSNCHDDPGRTMDDYEPLRDGRSGLSEGVVVIRDPEVVAQISDLLAGGGA